jgi:hypothetical protein
MGIYAYLQWIAFDLPYTLDDVERWIDHAHFYRFG